MCNKTQLCKLRDTIRQTCSLGGIFIFYEYFPRFLLPTRIHCYYTLYRVVVFIRIEMHVNVRRSLTNSCFCCWSFMCWEIARNRYAYGVSGVI